MTGVQGPGSPPTRHLRPGGRNRTHGPTPTRVAIVIGRLTGRGAEKQVSLLASSIDRREFDLQVVSFTSGGVWADYLRERDVPVHVVPRLSHYDLSRHARLYHCFRRLRPHVVVAELSEANAYATPAAVALGVHGIVSTYRTVDFVWDRRRELAERFLHRYVDVQLVNSQAISRAVAERLGTTADRHWVIHNMLDPTTGSIPRTQARRRLAIPDHAFAVGMLAAIAPVKRQDIALRALARIREKCPRLHLVILGDGQPDACMNMARELGVLHRTIFAGFRDDAHALLSAFDLTINCSDREGGSSSVVESLAAGVPVFATAVGGNREFVAPGERGELFAPGDHDGLALLLRRAHDGQIDLAAYGRAGQRYALGSFDLEGRLRETEELLRRIRRLPRRRPFARRGPAVHQ